MLIYFAYTTNILQRVTISSLQQQTPLSPIIHRLVDNGAWHHYNIVTALLHICYLPHFSLEGQPAHPEQQDLPALTSLIFLYIMKPV